MEILTLMESTNRMEIKRVKDLGWFGVGPQSVHVVVGLSLRLRTAGGEGECLAIAFAVV